MDRHLSGFAPAMWADGHASNRSTMSTVAQACAEHPELPQCQAGIYSYILNHHANMAFVLCFVMLLFPWTCVVILKRRAHLYSAAVFAGLAFEIMGYAARVWSHDNQLQRDPFYMQIVCLTVGPAFLAAAIYFCMRRIVVCFDPRHSILAPESYTRLFIPCDLVSLILQATGGALAASGHKARDQPALDKGTNVMIAGLSFQVFTMFVFGCLAVAFWRRVVVDHRSRFRNGIMQDPNIVAIRYSLSFRAFVLSITGSTLFIFARCCYRVAELSGGWRGNLMKNQTLFIVCEGIFVLLASMLLVIAHPAMAASVVLDAAGGEFGPIRGTLPNLRCFKGGENRVDQEIGLNSVTGGRHKGSTAAGPVQGPPPANPQDEAVSPL